MDAIPSHLSRFSWYAEHCAWLIKNGASRHDPAGAAPVRANLTGATLLRAN